MKVFKPVKSKGETYVFKLDLEDYLKIKTSFWCCINGKKESKYLKISDGLYHRVVTGAKIGEIVDHKNRNTFDNTKDNLRICSVSENNRNTNRELKCINYNKINKNWRVRIISDKKIFEVGSFKNKNDAIIAYNSKVKELHGEFAVLHKIGEL